MIDISDKLHLRIKEAVEDKGFLLYYIDKEIVGNQKHLIIYINKENYDTTISIDDCVEVTRSINEFIDDHLDEEYILEISSSGINRKLYTEEHFREVIDDKIKVQLSRKVEGIEGKKIEGFVKSVQDDHIILDDYEIKFKDIKKANYIGSEND